DGTFKMNLNARVADQSSFFQYSSSGDTVEATGHAAAGEGSVTADSATTYNGGTSPADVRIVLQQVSAATATLTPITTVLASPSPTVAPPATTPAFTPTPAPPLPVLTPTQPPPFALPPATQPPPVQPPA